MSRLSDEALERIEQSKRELARGESFTVDEVREQLGLEREDSDNRILTREEYCRYVAATKQLYRMFDRPPESDTGDVPVESTDIDHDAVEAELDELEREIRDE